MNLIDHALAANRPALSEYDAKRFLSGFGIPICREALVADPGAAVAEAVRIGFPVVVKASGATLIHKTEAGGVALNLRSEREVREEGQRLLQIPGCDGLLVQEMVWGDRELVCGLMRDAQLGPCVMFGLGGIFTETLDDAVFRVAPLTPTDALEMMTEIRSVKILGAFRGQPPVKLEALSRLLVTLGEIGLRHDAVQAIDINPVKIRADGAPVAVDALISLAPKEGAQR
jgi:acetyl-CoA synthetase (ADP-forming)